MNVLKKALTGICRIALALKLKPLLGQHAKQRMLAGKTAPRLNSDEGNELSRAGEKAACKTGLPYCMSDVAGEDANDLHQRAGLTALCALLMTVRRTEAAMR